MIFSHDIPNGAKLYFGEKAKIKREIEHIASEVFYNFEFEEIITPYFSYHQFEALNEKELIRFVDKQNRSLALRGDSSIDIIRLVIKRLKSEAKKWFYIQPVFRTPSTEINQIGAEWFEGDLKEILKVNLTIFKRLNRNYPLIISHIQIPKKVVELTDLNLEDIKKMRLYKFSDWVKKLAYIDNPKELSIKQFPLEIQDELKEVKEFALQFNSKLALLEVANLKYYTDIFYRFVFSNYIIAKGGEYKVDGVKSSGFSIYTDNLLKDING